MVSAEDIKDNWHNIDGIRVHYLTAGETGSPVVLLHGGGLDYSRLSYGLTIGPLSRRHRVFALDWPGYGYSDRPRISYTTGFFVGFLDRFIASLGLEKAGLVGISMGGAIAAEFALRSPPRVGRLILVDSYGLGNQIPAQPLVYCALRLPLLGKMLGSGFRRSRTLLYWALRRLVFDPARISEELVRDVRRVAEISASERAFLSWLRTEVGWRGLHTDLVSRLPEIRVPTLILHGREDRTIPVAWAQRAHRLISGSRLHVFPGCAHWPPREKTEEFNRLVLEFLAVPPESAL